MDVSETYIKMCGKAEEIQGDKRISGLVHGDYYVYMPTRQWDIIYDASKCYKFGMIDSFWLPRQDQLQAIMLSDFVQQEGGYKPIYWLLHRFEHWLPDCRYIATSMEQLWLAFVMKEKYNKKWTGNEWSLFDKNAIVGTVYP